MSPSTPSTPDARKNAFGRLPILCACILALGACGDDATPMDGSVPSDAAPDGQIAPQDAALDADGLDGGGSDTGDSDGGSPPDGGVPTDAAGPSAAPCDELAAALPTRSGTTWIVAPAGDGQVTSMGRTMTLRQAVNQAESGDTVLLEDGTYTFPEASGGSYTGIYITTANITVRSASGNADAVILDSAYGDHGDQTAPVTIAAEGVVLADLTIRASIFHLVHLWDGGDDAILHGLRLIDGGQQFVKASPGAGRVDDVQVTCSEFLMTDAGRDNVWGYGAQDGNTTCYTGGIDTHDSRNWQVLYNRFDGIYCTADGVARPAHGRKAADRGGQSYRGGLSEHAIHMWDSEEGSAHLIEGNLIHNCARGIGIGLRDQVYGTQIRNNIVWSTHAGSREHDVGIVIERGRNIRVENNTVFYTAPDAYPNAIEYRFDNSAGLEIRNNLTNGRIRARNGADAALENNIDDAEGSLFVDAAGGDLHLAGCGSNRAVGAGATVDRISQDFDGEARSGTNDVGADQCAE